MELSYFIYKYINSTRIWSTSFLISGSLISLSFFIKNEVNLGNGFNIFRFCLSFLVLYFSNNISNLVNTYYDFINGLDKKETSADKTLFQNSIKITLNDIEFFIKITYLGVLISLITLLVNCNLQFNEIIYHVLPIIITISFISYFYTAPPISFKYRALGEISASFNYFSIVPFPIYFQNIQLFKDYFNEIFNYSMILTISCCTIIFSNNIRDLKIDKMSNIITIPIIIGENLSYSIYFSIYFLRNNKTKERINKKQTDLFEKEERVRKSSELGEKLRFMTDDTRKQFLSLSSNQTYHNEKSYNNIKQLELDALKNQDETSKMLMCMRVFCSSFSNSPQMTPSLQPTIQFNNNFTPSPNSACSYQNLNSNADVDKTLLKLK
ncbi:hypothetical protein ACTFIR_001186 [Dictyostelium discoideum]